MLIAWVSPLASHSNHVKISDAVMIMCESWRWRRTWAKKTWKSMISSDLSAQFIGTRRKPFSE
tara:strand:- start:1513 stop:1701 length:189 start_codon:yes stop_codon:yes gene_type:complete